MKWCFTRYKIRDNINERGVLKSELPTKSEQSQRKRKN